jgi:hypothetical protein
MYVSNFDQTGERYWAGREFHHGLACIICKKESTCPRAEKRRLDRDTTMVRRVFKSKLHRESGLEVLQKSLKSSAEIPIRTRRCLRPSGQVEKSKRAFQVKFYLVP